MIYYAEAKSNPRSHDHWVRLQLDQPEAQALGLVAVDLFDCHCIEPECQCSTGLRIGRTYTASKRDWDQEVKEFRLDIEPATGAIRSPRPESGLGRWVYDALARRIDTRLLNRLRDRHRETRQWGRQNGWRYVDWSQFSPGDLVGWAEVFPQDEAFVFREGGQSYLIDEQHCCTLGCDCTEVVIAIIRIGSKGGGDPMGYVRYDLSSGRQLVEEAVGCARASLLSLFSSFLRQHPEAVARLREHSRFMGGTFAQFLHDTYQPKYPPRSVAAPIALGGATKAGRNDPCPCGSGKKYKRCCLNG